MPSLRASIPRRIQIAMGLTITAMLLPTIAASHPGGLPELSQLPDLAIAIVREALIGLLIGTTIQLIITGIQLGGEVTSTSGSMQMAATADPETGQAIPSLAKFVGLLVIAVLLAAGGHRMILNVLLESFHAMPPGRVTFNDSMMNLVMDQLTTAMAAGIRVAAPVVAALLLTNLVTGLISRTLPQLNVLAIGLSINALALLVVSAITIGSAGLIFQDELVAAVDRLGQLW
ncbi:MAG: flagellar biosynthetic protein FliR [Pirellulaceae bacterium]|nr:flagellar biosynthetic protein FliR [Pirellulaceae bacterium]